MTLYTDYVLPYVRDEEDAKGIILCWAQEDAYEQMTRDVTALEFADDVHLMFRRFAMATFGRRDVVPSDPHRVYIEITRLATAFFLKLIDVLIVQYYSTGYDADVYLTLADYESCVNHELGYETATPSIPEIEFPFHIGKLVCVLGRLGFTLPPKNDYNSILECADDFIVRYVSVAVMCDAALNHFAGDMDFVRLDIEKIRSRRRRLMIDSVQISKKMDMI